MIDANPEPDLRSLESSTSDNNSAQQDPHWRREHFVPIRKADLVDRLAKELDSDDRSLFVELCHLLDTIFRLEFQNLQARFKHCYSGINPDSDLCQLQQDSRSEREKKSEDLFSEFDKLLVRANFDRLSQTQIQKAVGAASDWGVRLRVDFNLFDQINVYARGDIVDRRERRKFYFLKEEVDVPIYQRLAVIYRLKSEDNDHKNDLVYIKLLKNIPKEDLDMMLPGAQIRMSLLDGGKILLPTVSGAIIAGIKIFKGALLLAVAGFYGLLAFIGFIIATLSYGAKSFFGYKRIKASYEHDLTKRLYYQNLDTNAGVIYRLIDEANEQEFRETILAYFVLWRNDSRLLDEDELDRIVEAKLKKWTMVDIDFEVDDALRKVRDFGLAEESETNKWRPIRIHRALRNLDMRLHETLDRSKSIG